MFPLWMVLLSGLAAAGPAPRQVWTSAEIDALLREARGDRPLLVERAYAIVLRVRTGQAGAVESSGAADQVLHIRRGRGTVTVDGRAHEVGPGDMVHIPRNTAHRIDPMGGRLETVAVRIFGTGEGLPPRAGFLAPRRMPDVLKKAEIDATIENHDRNQPLLGLPGYTMNYVIYPGQPGPWEAHRGCADIYFLQRGTAKAYLGGRIVNGREVSPGEVRGEGVEGAREYQIGPGDLVHIPRNGPHHVVPAGDKLGYVLMKIWAE